MCNRLSIKSEISETSLCNLCHAESQYKFSVKGDGRKRFHIFECPACGVAFTFPQPGRKLLASYYTQGYYGEDVRRMSFIREIFLRLLQMGKRKSVEAYKKGGRIMDIGCGDGRFLQTMAGRGWEGYGVDTSPDASAILRAKGIKYFDRELVSLNLPENYFDVITLWHVLEHLKSPWEEIKEIRRILKDDGFLFMTMPNFNSLQASFGKGEWFHLDPPRHLWHFSPESVSSLLKRSGFAIKSENRLSLFYNLFGWWQTILNRCGLPFNYLYYMLKREREYRKIRGFTGASAQLFIITSIYFIPLFLFLTLWEVALGRGGSISVVAQKKLN